jgi:hypothetical protein
MVYLVLLQGVVPKYEYLFSRLFLTFVHLSRFFQSCQSKQLMSHVYKGQQLSCWQSPIAIVNIFSKFFYLLYVFTVLIF